MSGVIIRLLGRLGMKARLALAGFIVGFVWVLTATIYALVEVGGVPGLLEMVVILLTAALVGAMGGVVGFAVGCVLDGVRRKGDGVGPGELNDATREDDASER